MLGAPVPTIVSRLRVRETRHCGLHVGLAAGNVVRPGRHVSWRTGMACWPENVRVVRGQYERDDRDLAVSRHRFARSPPDPRLSAAVWPSCRARSAARDRDLAISRGHLARVRTPRGHSAQRLGPHRADPAACAVAPGRRAPAAPLSAAAGASLTRPRGADRRPAGRRDPQRHEPLSGPPPRGFGPFRRRGPQSARHHRKRR